MTPSNSRAAFWQGVLRALPFVVVVTPFGLLFGIVGTEAGLNLAEVMGMTIIVIAGASQLTALQMMQENAPTLIVVLTALAVNLRMAMYSAALTPHLGAARGWVRAAMAYVLVDHTYVLSDAEFARNPARPIAEKVAFFFGTALPICPLWVLATWIGATVGQAIPPEFALDFAVPITFLAMIAPALPSLPHIISATVSVALALVFAGVPHNLGLLLAAAGAMAAGAQAELWFDRRKEHAAS